MHKLYLITNKRFKKKYDTISIYLGDEQVFTFKIDEWQIHRNDEWIELTRIDQSKMECFPIVNVMRVSGYKEIAKPVKTDTIPLKPVV